jgi:hypothetical protein
MLIWEDEKPLESLLATKPTAQLGLLKGASFNQQGNHRKGMLGMDSEFQQIWLWKNQVEEIWRPAGASSCGFSVAWLQSERQERSLPSLRQSSLLQPPAFICWQPERESKRFRKEKPPSSGEKNHV